MHLVTSSILGTAKHLKPLSFVSAEVQIYFCYRLFEGAPLGLPSISRNVSYIMLVYIIFSGCIAALNPFTGIPVLSFQAFTADH